MNKLGRLFIVSLLCILASWSSARVSAQDDIFKECDVPTPGSVPSGMTVYKGLVYFTEYDGNKIGRLDPVTGIFDEWNIPTEYSDPREIAIYDGLVYFNEVSAGKICRLTPRSTFFMLFGFPLTYFEFIEVISGCAIMVFLLAILIVYILRVRRRLPPPPHPLP